MEHAKGRRKWVSNEKKDHFSGIAPSTKEEIPPQYQHYLDLLHERNRLVRRLRKKDKKQIDLEKKEKGFTLYLNSDSKEAKQKSQSRDKPQRAKTAGAFDHRTSGKLRGSDQPVTSKSGGAGSKAREKRRNWQIGSVEFTTADGQRQRIKPPDILSGKYKDDFEESSSDDDHREIVQSMSSLDNDDDIYSSINTPRKKTSYLRRVAAAKREEIESENKVSIRMEDVKKLRESLQTNKLIRQSLALDQDSDDSDGERISPIDEELEESIVDESQGGLEEDTSVRQLKLFKPGDTLVMEFQPPPVKSSSSSVRPVSANRKSVGKPADSKEEADAVLKAMREENKKVETFSKVSRPLPQPKQSGAPTKRSQEVSRPTTLERSKDKGTPNKGTPDKGTPPKGTPDRGKPSTPVKSEEPQSPIENVIQKVLKLNPRQQKQLLQTLNHIDVQESGLATNKTSSSNLADSLSASWSNKCPETDRLEVTVELLSNWGHPHQVGLTELQFFDHAGALVPIKPSDVSVHGATGPSNKVEVLFNGKSKTTKERNMWSCKFDGRPIEFSILLINPDPGKVFTLGAVRVWNWNQKINNLNIGVRHIRIFYGGELLFNGEVDKGCGNQVFDYSKHIVFASSGSKSKHSSSGTNSGKLHSPTKSSSSSMQGNFKKGLPSPVPSESRDKNVTRSGSHHTFRSISQSSASSASSSGSLHSAKARNQSGDRGAQDLSQDNGIRSETRTLVRPTVSQRPRSGASSVDRQSPSAVATESSRTSDKKPVQSPVNSKQEATVSRLNGKPSKTDNVSSKLNTGEREQSRKKEIPTWFKGKVEDDAAKKKNNLKGDADLQSQLDEELKLFSQEGKDENNSEGKGEEADQLTPMKKIEKSRAKWRQREEDLEESWGSLSFFDKSQRGRLSMDITDDALDEHIAPSVKPSPQPAESGPKLAIPDDPWSDEDTEFVIPELPYGCELVINIKTTWGDHHYVGLTGVQVFSQTGDQVHIVKVWANPSDINILPEYTRDPRVVTNIIDNVNRTRDDVHMWLAPFTAGNNHLVYMKFAQPCKIALIRIWNYNKSRIHSFRGAKDVVMTLDGSEIFKGEIARACGGIEGGTEAFGDTILFTTDEDILEAVSKHDDAFEGESLSDDEEDVQRPSTADADDDTRPFTRAAGLLPSDGTIVNNMGDSTVYKANRLELIFESTWGDHHYLGLTGLEVMGPEGEAIPLTLDMLVAQPQDLRNLPGNQRDDRTLDKLVDGTNVTCHDSHMWLIPFTKGEYHSLTITFPEQTLVSGLRVWNYNKSPEDTYRGAKVVQVQINKHVVSPPDGYLLRKGPGVCHFDFAQELLFGNTANTQEPNTEDVAQVPRGFIFQLQLYSTWGDQYYIGLNGIEFYDASFNKIELTETNISAYPDSVNVLDNVSSDARTPDKLIDGVNDTTDGKHMWLAPILPTITNRVYVIFDQPTSVSMIKIWNYSKTVNRGVKDFGLLVDDLLVYNGCLQTVSGGARGILPTCSAPIPHHTVLFSDNKDIISRERNTIISNQTEDQDIQLLNDTKVVSKFSKATSKPVNQALRPKTSVVKTARR